MDTQPYPISRNFVVGGTAHRVEKRGWPPYEICPQLQSPKTQVKRGD